MLVGDAGAGEDPGRVLARALRELGVETTYIGKENDARRVVSAAVDHRADAIELCVIEGGGVPLLRQLVRELTSVGRRDLSIVVHKAGRGSRRFPDWGDSQASRLMDRN